MAESSRLHGSKRRRRTTCGWKLTVVFLVLSQNVWKTLQCSSSSSIKSKTIPRREQHVDSSLQDSSNEISEENFPSQSEEVIGLRQQQQQQSSLSSVPYFFRRVRNSGGGTVETFQHCSYRLKFELEKICGGQFHDPTVPKPRSLTQGKRSLLRNGNGEEVGVPAPRRVSRSLVDECCRRPCTEKNVRKYCKSRKEIIGGLIESVSGSNTEAFPTTSQQDPEPALYYPLVHIVNFIQRHLSNQRQNSINEEERNVPLPLARVQENPFKITSRFSPLHHRRADSNFETNLDKMAGFRNSAFSTNNNAAVIEPELTVFVLPSTQGSAPDATQTKGSNIHHQHSKENIEIARPSLRLPPGAVTSTLPPILIPLGPQTNDNDFITGFNQFQA